MYQRIKRTCVKEKLQGSRKESMHEKQQGISKGSMQETQQGTRQESNQKSSKEQGNNVRKSMQEKWKGSSQKSK